MVKADTQIELNKDLADEVLRKYFGIIIGVIIFFEFVFCKRSSETTSNFE